MGGNLYRAGFTPLHVERKAIASNESAPPPPIAVAGGYAVPPAAGAAGDLG